jgi:hypothetical protein
MNFCCFRERAGISQSLSAAHRAAVPAALVAGTLLHPLNGDVEFRKLQRLGAILRHGDP